MKDSQSSGSVHLPRFPSDWMESEQCTRSGSLNFLHQLTLSKKELFIIELALSEICFTYDSSDSDCQNRLNAPRMAVEALLETISQASALVECSAILRCMTKFAPDAG